MTDLLLHFLHGYVLAFGLILPLGIQNSFLLNQGAITKHYRHTLPVIFTAGLADTLLILLAILGVSLILLEYPVFKTGLIIFGVIFLLYVGYRMWMTVFDPNAIDGNALQWTTHKKIMFTLAISLLNPHAILDSVGVIGVTSAIYEGIDKWMFTLGVLINSWIWFFMITWAGRFIRKFHYLYRIQGKIAAIIMWLNVIVIMTLLY